jgi:hypothetical protein
MPRPTPQDHKPKRPKTAVDPGPFTFMGLDGEEYELPPAEALTAGLIRQNRHKDEVDMAFSILEALCEPEVLEALDALPVRDFNTIVLAWQTSINTSPGK